MFSGRRTRDLPEVGPPLVPILDLHPWRMIVSRNIWRVIPRLEHATDQSFELRLEFRFGETQRASADGVRVEGRGIRLEALHGVHEVTCVRLREEHSVDALRNGFQGPSFR